MLSAHEIIERFDMAVANVVNEARTHLLHALGVDAKQLAHDAQTAAAPIIAQAEQLGAQAIQAAQPLAAEAAHDVAAVIEHPTADPAAATSPADPIVTPPSTPAPAA